MHADGTVSIGQWGRDATLGPDVVAVRQNLDLVVDNGAAVPGLRENPAGQWGSASNQFPFTWRSGLGTDRAGNLIYVAGDKLTLTTLADAMPGMQGSAERYLKPDQRDFFAATLRPSIGAVVGS